MRKVVVGLVLGDGSAPEGMAQACAIAIKAARKDGIKLVFEKIAAGWAAFNEFGDTLPAKSLKRATELGLLFFGGVGEKALDDTIGKQHPEMLPEGRCLLTFRDEWQLLVNERPAIYHPELRSIAKVRESSIPDKGINQCWLRFLLEDSYYGNRHFIKKINPEAVEIIGLKLKDKVTGEESVVSDLAYYTIEKVTEFFRYAFTRARGLHVPLICVDKKNVLARYVFWRKIATKIHEQEFSDVEMRCHYSDDTTRLLFNPALLDGVIACGNEHGDMLSDGALEAVGSMGLMYSSAKNLKTGQALFESGAGTFPEAKGKNITNPIGRIMAGSLLDEHIGALNGARAIEQAVLRVLKEGYRTPDLCGNKKDPYALASPGWGDKVLGTKEMGELILSYL